jgi:hypothetical protein
MTDQGWIAVATLAFFMLVQFGIAIWWASGMSQQVKGLKEEAKGNGAMRDLVIELRTEMRGFREAIKDLAEGMRGGQRRRTPNQDEN